jgi:hypothetical protein
MRAILILGVAALVLTGCGLTDAGDKIRGVIKEKGATAMDAKLDNLLWGLCLEASHGSVERKFGVSEDLAAAYNKVCDHARESTTLTGTE